MSRWTVLGLVLGLIVTGILYDRVEFAPEPEPLPIPERVVSPILDASDRLSNVWFCPVGSGGTGGYATHELAITNLGDEPAVANIDLVTDDGPGPGLRLEVQPLTTEVVDVAALDPAPSLGAVVEVVNGRGVVGHTVSTLRGRTQGPCGTDTSDTWYFADGVTTRDAFEYIALLNPFPEDVVFSVSFQSSTRTRVPKDLQSAVVSGRSVRVLNVGDFVTREDHVATRIETIQGQLAVERLQVLDGTLGPMGAALQLGVADPALEWTLPAGRVHDGGDHRLVIANPAAALAEVDVEFDLDPADRSSYGLVPIEVSVQPGRFVVLDLGQAVADYGLPLPYDFGLRVGSANEVAIVVERWQVAPMVDTSLIGAGGSDARLVGAAGLGGRWLGVGLGTGPGVPGLRYQTDADPGEVPEDELDVEPPASTVQPSATVGVASSRGVELLAREWIVPYVDIGEGGTTAIVVSGPAGTRLEVQLVLAGELLPPLRVTMPAAGIATIPIPGEEVRAAPILVTASEPVVAEAQVVVPDSRLDVVPAVPIVALP